MEAKGKNAAYSFQTSGSGTLKSRRDFLKGTAWMGAAAMAAGCMGGRLNATSGGSMSGYAAPPMKRVRVGFVGVGGRGSGAVRRVAMIPGCEVTALCDIVPEKISALQKYLRDKGCPAAGEFLGDEAYKALCDRDDVDVIYNATPRDMHVPINVYAMRAGKHVLTEVPGSMTIDGCWEMVDASEATRRHCMMLENCCYGEFELLAFNLCRQGVLGEIVHADGGYIHDQRGLQFKRCRWRLNDTLTRKGNYYPTHGFGPLCKCLDVNRGDRLDYLVSMESAATCFEGYAREVMKGTDLENAKMSRGDVNISFMRTVKGKLITLQHDVAMPRPYDRVNLLSGTKGMMRGIKASEFKVCFEETTGDMGAHGYFDAAKAAEVREKYMHPLWRSAGAIAQKVGGHGGMDFLMDLRWAFCLQNGLPLDTDVYDMATWSCIVELTDRSVRANSRPVDFPDFTRGGWKTAKPFETVDVDPGKMGIA